MKPSRIADNGLTILGADATWRKDLKAAGLGWTFSPFSGDLPNRHSALCNNVSLPLMAEALAMRATLDNGKDPHDL